MIVGNTCYKISGGKLIEIKGIPIHSRALVFFWNESLDNMYEILDLLFCISPSYAQPWGKNPKEDVTITLAHQSRCKSF